MSFTKRASRRLSLLAGSSVFAASLCATGAMLAPTAGIAATNPCGTDPAANGQAPDVIVCPVATYPTGIQHTSAGNISVTFSPGTNLGTGGVVTTAGDADDSVTVIKAAGGTMLLNAQAFPVMADTTSQNGDIVVDFGTGAVFANNGATSHAIRAISSGTGDVTITTRANIAAVGSTTPTSGTAAIEARSFGGGDVTYQNLGGATTGRLYGIFASTTGSGNLTISGTGAFNSSAANGAGIHATTQTGLLTINAVGSGGAGSGIRTFAGGDAILNVGALSDGIANWSLEVTTASGTNTEINVTDILASGGSGTYDRRTFRLLGAGEVDFSGDIEVRGTFDFSAHTGPVSLTLEDGGAWLMGADSLLAAGNDTAIIAAGGLLVATTPTRTVSQTDGVEAPVTINFQTGSDTLRNDGVLLVGPRWVDAVPPPRTEMEMELAIEGLETFENSGQILLGGFSNLETTATDGWYDDILSMPGAHFVGLGGEILMDVNFGGSGQTACDASLRNADGDMPAADCVAIIGGSTEGVTYLAINDLFPSDRGGFNAEGTVLIDVSGGDSAPGHFVISPNSSRYSAAHGGSIDKGMFFYTVAYDPDTQQHKLLGLPGQNAFQFPALAQAAHSLWRTSTAGWLNRQADLRGNFDGETGGGVWGRISTEFVDRDLAQSTTAAGNTFSFDNSYEQDSYAVTGGFDILSASDGANAIVSGLMLGYANSELDYGNSPNASQLDGFTGGAYASWLSGGLFVDAAVNANRLILKTDVPALALLPEGTILDTNLVSVGVQAEAGYRFPLLANAFIEPLAGLSYVRSNYDDLVIVNSDAARPGIEVEFDDPTSLRGSLGVRAGLDESLGPWRAQLSVLGRVWEEFEDETNVILHSTGPDALLVDGFGGTFSEFGVGAGVYSASGMVSGLLNFGGQFADNYHSVTASAGVRVNW